MASFNVKHKVMAMTTTAIVALLMVSSFAIADGLPSVASSSVANVRSDPADVPDLAAQVQTQLLKLAPAGLRIDRVELGCKPAAGSVLKAVAPGIAQLTSRAFMVELQQGERSTYCSATMDASRMVLAANRDIQPNEPITSDDFQEQWVDAFAGVTGALLEFPGPGPYVSASVIRAGQPLYQSALLRPIAVHPGEMMMVVVKNGPISVRAQLQAQSQAAIGDTVTAVNPASGIPVTVTVTGPRNAELVIQ